MVTFNRCQPGGSARSRRIMVAVGFLATGVLATTGGDASGQSVIKLHESKPVKTYSLLAKPMGPATTAAAPTVERDSQLVAGGVAELSSVDSVWAQGGNIAVTVRRSQTHSQQVLRSVERYLDYSVSPDRLLWQTVFTSVVRVLSYGSTVIRTGAHGLVWTVDTTSHTGTAAFFRWLTRFVQSAHFYGCGQIIASVAGLHPHEVAQMACFGATGNSAVASITAALAVYAQVPGTEVSVTTLWVLVQRQPR